MRFDRFLAAALAMAAGLTLLAAGMDLAASVRSHQLDRQHAIDCAVQGRPVDACCRSRLDPERASCPLPALGRPTYQVIP